MSRYIILLTNIFCRDTSTGGFTSAPSISSVSSSGFTIGITSKLSESVKCLVVVSGSTSWGSDADDVSSASASGDVKAVASATGTSYSEAISSGLTAGTVYDVVCGTGTSIVLSATASATTSGGGQTISTPAL